jgi:ferritin-like metal-binding protein YciE
MATTQTRSRGRDEAPQAVIDTDDIAQLEAGRTLVIQLLQEAQGAEAFAATTLQAHIAMTPASAYRRILERHLRETRDQSERLQRRLGELGVKRSLLASGVGVATTAVGTALALGKGPIDLLRGRAGEEKLFKNIKDEVTTEAQEIVTYEGIEAAAHAVGDVRTAELAASIRDQEQRAFDDLREQVPALAAAAVRSIVAGDSSYDLSRTGAVQAARNARDEALGEAEELVDDAREASRTAASRTRSTARKATASARRTARSAEKPAARSTRTASTSSSSSSSSSSANGAQPIAGYDDLNANEVNAKLSDLTPAQLRKVEDYEKSHAKRTTVLERIKSLKSA